MPRRSRARSSGARPSFRTRSGIPTEGRKRRTARRSCRGPSCRARTSTGPTIVRRRHAPHRTIIYETHVKGISKRHPDVPPELQGTYAGLAHPAVVGHLPEAGRDHGRAAAGPPVHPLAAPGRTEPAQLLGLRLDRFPCPAQRVRERRPAWRAGRGVQGHGPDPARRRNRGDPRRRLQPHRRRQSPRARCSRSRASTTRPTTA